MKPRDRGDVARRHADRQQEPALRQVAGSTEKDPGRHRQRRAAEAAPHHRPAAVAAGRLGPRVRRTTEATTRDADGDRHVHAHQLSEPTAPTVCRNAAAGTSENLPVSYTHLTLPTILLV